MSRFRAASELSYHLAQATRHANQLETHLVHGIDTSDVLLMLAADFDKAAEAFTDYRNSAVKARQSQEKIVDDVPF